MDESLEEYCWTVKGDNQFPDKLKPFSLTPRMVLNNLDMLGFGIRLYKYMNSCKRKNVECIADMLKENEINTNYGAPIGGIGTGTIGRSFTGDFCRYQLVPGLYEHKTVDANMFTVCIRKKASTTYQQALSTRRSKLKGLKSWNMSFSPAHITYHALYPESWTVYDLPGQNVKLTCHQLSPVIPHNYKDSSLPCALFNWTIENSNKEDIELSLMFTWQSGSASDKFELANVSSSAFDSYKHEGQEISGVSLKQTLRGMPLEYCIGVKKGDGMQDVTYNCQFYPEDEQSSQSLWAKLLADGKLSNETYSPTMNMKGKMAVAVNAKCLVKANSKFNIEFSLVWNMPVVSFKTGSHNYKRFYTKYFPEDDEKSALKIACYSHSQRSNWLKQIEEWRKPILNDKNLPTWYKTVLFNELYFIADGGTVWFNVDREQDADIFPVSPLVKEYGRFAYLEGHEYKMYNTYDVHFYASFALLKLWPKLQLSLQYDFAETIEKVNDVQSKFLCSGKIGLKKSPHCIPHDIGQPGEEVWQFINSYNFHDTKNWRDLNIKFILSAYRDYYHTKDLHYLEDMWKKIQPLLPVIESQDCDKDGLIDSEGEPDQTYDAWSVKGASAYCGGLHVAALHCVSKMAELMNEKETHTEYENKLKRAREAYNTKLWNGKYYNYDCSTSNQSDSVMADMCCGHWFLRSSGFKYECFDQEKIKSCLETVYEFNVMKFADGKCGAVNGMRPDGKIDYTSIQSEEVWTGVTDAVASLMIFEKMPDKAWKTLEGLYDKCYNRLGLAFQTPEAVYINNSYRSLGYMRALCIWAVQYALDELASSSNND